MAPAITSMATLNAGGMRALQAVGDGVHAATDVTGFGLLGHLSTMVEASGVAARVFADAVPVFEHAWELVEQKAVPGGTTRNLEAVAERTRWTDGVSDSLKTLLCDAQTSGGLLTAVDRGRLDDLLRALAENGTPAAAVVGEIVEGAEPTIEVTHAQA
jgi:selenide,water dikinase